MTSIETRRAIQTLLGTTPDGRITLEPPGETLKAVFALARADDDSQWPPAVGALQPGTLLGDGTWPFAARIDGGDIVCEDISITCFGGNGDGTNSDPQDNGDTASGVNTNRHSVVGCSIAMDGRSFPKLSPAEHRALDGSPFPRLMNGGHTAWGVPVEVTIGGKTFLLPDGIVDLGPGKQASKPGDPHALDLTVPAAALVRPDIPLHKLSTRFSARGSFRIKGGAQYVA